MSDVRDESIEQIAQQFKLLVNATPRSETPAPLHHEEVRKGIKAALSRPEGAVKDRHLWHVLQRLKIEHFAGFSNNQSYINAMGIIRGDTAQEPAVADLSDEASWKQAIQLTHGHLLDMANPEKFAEQAANTEKHLISLAEQAKFLLSKGYEVSVRGSEFILSDKSQNDLARDILGLLRRLGGPTTLGGLFKAAERHYDEKQERYHLVRRVPNLPRDFRPDFPFGYLLKLAVKHPGPPFFPETNNEAVWKKAVELSTAYAALYHVQPSSIFDGMTQGPYSILPFLKKNALYDLIFSIPQLRPRDLPNLLLGLFGRLDQGQFQRICGWTLSDYVAVQRAIYSAPAGPNQPFMFNLDSLTPLLKTLSRKTVEDILRSISHEQKANDDFNFPHDAPKIDFQSKPLIKVAGTQFLLANRAWCAPAFVDALVAKLRDLGWKNIDQQIGTSAEQFLRETLNSRGVTVRWGKYSHGGIDGECDAVVETDETIFFIEHKKKILTRMARAGSEAHRLTDASKSLLDAQLQAGGHELVLRSNGHLNLLRGKGKSYRLELKNRGIERIAISLTDFGSLQDRAVLNNFLTILLTVRFGTDDPAWKENLIQLKEKCEELLLQFEQLKKLGIDPKGAGAFFNCWFFSLPQLLILLDDVSSNETFKKVLWSMRHVTFSSRDLYFEYRRMRSIRGDQAR